MAPGANWVVDLPVTTASTGATEPDRADPNPDPARPQDDELAWNSAAFEVRRSDINSVLLPAESQKVALRVPTIYGNPNGAVTASNETSTGVGTDPHTTQLHAPLGGSVKLMDGSTPVNQLVKPGVGTYTVDPPPPESSRSFPSSASMGRRPR